MPRLLCCCLPALLLISASKCFADDLPQTRWEFAEAFNQLEKELPDLKGDVSDAFGPKPGNSKARVLELLGKPDEIEAAFAFGFRQTWKYGTSGPGTCPTLGAITFSDKNEIEWTSGQGKPPQEALFSERVLRTYLQAIWEVRDQKNRPENPRDIIQAVNLLQPLGKDKALIVLREYLRVTGDHVWEEGALIVLRTLFNSPDEIPRDGKLDAEYLEEVVGSGCSLALTIGDIPYAFDYRVGTSGAPYTAEDAIPFYEEHGIIRDTPLVPSQTPLQDIDEFVKQYPKLFDEEAISFSLTPREFQKRALTLMESVYHAPLNGRGDILPWGNDEKTIQQRLQTLDEASKVELVWNRKVQRYTFPNGTILPPREPVIDVPDFWRPEKQDRKLIVEIQRWDQMVVYVSLRPEVEEPESKKDLLFEVYRVNQKEGIEEKIEIAQQYITDCCSNKVVSIKKVWLEEGKPIRIRLTLGHKTYISPVFKP